MTDKQINQGVEQVIKTHGDTLRKLAMSNKPTTIETAEEKLKELLSASEGRLGAYLNTVIADCEIDGKGQYFRDLFGEFEEEALIVINQLLQSSSLALLREVSEQVIGRDTQTPSERTVKYIKENYPEEILKLIMWGNNSTHENALRDEQRKALETLIKKYENKHD